MESYFHLMSRIQISIHDLSTIGWVNMRWTNPYTNRIEVPSYFMKNKNYEGKKALQYGSYRFISIELSNQRYSDKVLRTWSKRKIKHLYIVAYSIKHWNLIRLQVLHYISLAIYLQWHNLILLIHIAIIPHAS